MEWIGSRAQFQRATTRKAALVGFCAPWCVPCRLQGPILRRLAVRLDGRAFVGAVNVDRNRDLAAALDIRSIPTILIFHYGMEKYRFVGLQPELTLAEAVISALGAAPVLPEMA